MTYQPWGPTGRRTRCMTRNSRGGERNVCRRCRADILKGFGVPLALLVFVACQSDRDTAQASPSSRSATTTTVPAIAGPTKTVSETSIDTSSPSDLTAVDPQTGLDPGVRGSVPPGVVVPQRQDMRATLVIAAAELSLDQSGGTCSVIDGVSYVYVGQTQVPTGVLQWETGTGANPFLTWQVGGGETAMISNHGLNDVGLTLTLSADQRSGTFDGWFNLPVNNTANFRQMSGSFDCSPAALTIAGVFPLSLGSSTCSPDGHRRSAGGPGDAALLTIDPGSLTASGGFEGSLSWRVAGQTYHTLWLSGALSGTPSTASFVGLVAGQDGVEYSVSGSFSCFAA